jgi:hypothetical protein
VSSEQKLLSGSLHGAPSVVIEAIEDGADVNYKQSLAIKYAVQNNDIDLIRFLIRIGSEIPHDLLDSCTNEKVKLLVNRVKKLKKI